MDSRKEKLLAEHKDSGAPCLCRQMMEYRRQKFFTEYQELRRIFQHQKANGKYCERTFGALQKAGNKYKALVELIREIDDAEAGIDKMFEVVINGTRFYRRNENEHIKRTCRRKVPYAGHELALEALVEIQAKTSQHLEVYQCAYCGNWHVGHSVL
jgi:hypothetical protein